MKLKLTGIRKHFGEKEVLRGCGFTFQQGKIYGLLGRNGAGKTTLIDMITGKQAVSSGQHSPPMAANTGSTTVVEQRPKPEIS